MSETVLALDGILGALRAMGKESVMSLLNQPASGGSVGSERQGFISPPPPPAPDDTLLGRVEQVVREMHLCESIADQMMTTITGPIATSPQDNAKPLPGLASQTMEAMASVQRLRDRLELIAKTL